VSGRPPIPEPAAPTDDGLVESVSNPNGTRTLRVNGGRRKADDGTGQKVAVPSVLTKNGNRHEAVVGDTTVSVADSSADATNVLAWSTRGGARLTVGAPETSGPGLSNKSVSVPGVSKKGGKGVQFKGIGGADVDVNYDYLGAAGVKETVVLGSAPKGNGKVEFRFPVTVAGVTPVQGVDGVLFLDSLGEIVFKAPVGFAWDSVSGSADAIAGASVSRVSVTVEGTEKKGYTLVVSPDAAWLRDPARRYPVYVDPTILAGKLGNSDGYQAWASNWTGAVEQPYFGNWFGNQGKANIRFQLPSQAILARAV
jgi:hypothetical protein